MKVEYCRLNTFLLFTFTFYFLLFTFYFLLFTFKIPIQFHQLEPDFPFHFVLTPITLDDLHEK